MYERQYEYISKNREKYRGYSRKYYHNAKNDPLKLAHRKQVRSRWYEENKESIRLKQRDKKRHRKQQAIEYLGGECKECGGIFHPSVFEFHHRDPSEKDRDPSKMLQFSWDNLKSELDKCDLLCANCHRLIHHRWEE